MKFHYSRLLTISALVSSLVLPFSSQAAETQVDSAGMTVIGMGTETAAGGSAFFNIAEYPAKNVPRACTNDLYYLKLDNAGGRAIYAMLLYAQATGKKLRRFDWERISGPYGNICYISLVMLAE